MKTKLFPITLLVCAWCLILPLTVCADTGTYYGTATITTPANLGTIDLAFYLDVSGTGIRHDTSYIMLDKTLLFPAVLPKLLITNGVPSAVNGVPVVCTNEPNCSDVGPRVKTGHLSPTTFDLTTDDFTSTVSGKIVTRNILFSNAIVTNEGNSIIGIYTETISGLTPEVVTVTGSFILVKPTVPTFTLKDLNGDGWLDLNEIRAGGLDTSVIEFSDISYALHLFYNPLPGLKVGSPSDSTGQQTIKDALTEYYNAHKQ